MATFANILYDEAFKVVLTEPSNRRLLVKLIEFFLPGKTIQSITLDDKEQHGLILSDKNVTFDLLCTTDQNERFIVEMQFASQTSFRDRMLYYATYPIRSQIMERMKSLPNSDEKTIRKMDYSLSPVYVISILNFSMHHNKEQTLENGMISRYEICNRETGELMTNALHFIYLELGRLKWKQDEEDKCESLLEQLAFSLKYGHLLKQRPADFGDELLRLFFEATAFANMNEKQLGIINAIMTTELDIIARREFARNEGWEEGKALGLAEGRAEGRAEGAKQKTLEIAAKMKASGMHDKQICELTGLSEDELAAIR